MIEDFPDAVEGDEVIVSERKLRQVLKCACSHVKLITARYKIMCGCETCIIVDDIYSCVICWRKKYIRKLWKELNRMNNRDPNKATKKAALKKYIEHVFLDATGEVPKYSKGWDASQSLGCEKVVIN